nr:peroxiredoxin-like family protein [Cyanothece sp. BG0011]
MKVIDCLKETQALRVSDGNTVPILTNCQSYSRLLVIIWPQLGDFDTLEYAWWLNQKSSDIAAHNIIVKAIGIGNRESGLKFCDYTQFPQENLFVDPDGNIHKKLGLYQGLSWNIPGLNDSQKAWVNLMLMCAGIGSQGTLKEVLRGYTGDKKAPQLIADKEVVDTNILPPLKGSFFNLAGGKGHQRPFELATLRLRNMTEVLSNWKTYVPNAAYLTQRGATFLFDQQDNLLYEHRDPGILGFAENMSNPLSFLSLDSEQVLTNQT